MTHITKHNLEKNEAVDKVEKFLKTLEGRKFPGRVQIKNVNYSINSGAVDFSATVKIALLKPKVSGFAEIENNQIKMRAGLPKIIEKLAPEKKMKAEIDKFLLGEVLV